MFIPTKTAAALKLGAVTLLIAGAGFALHARAAVTPAPVAKAAVAPRVQLPPPEALIILIRSSIVALSQANVTNNYSVLSAMGSKTFRTANSPQSIAYTWRNCQAVKFQTETLPNPDGTPNRSSVSLGTPGTPVTLTNVAAGVRASDAVNLGQLQGAATATLAAANSYTDGRITALTFDLKNVASFRATGDSGKWSLTGGISGGPNSGVAASAGIDILIGN